MTTWNDNKKEKRKTLNYDKHITLMITRKWQQEDNNNDSTKLIKQNDINEDNTKNYFKNDNVNDNLKNKKKIRQLW